MVLPLPLLADCFFSYGSGRDEKDSGGEILRLIQIRFDDAASRPTRLWDLSPTGYWALVVCLPVKNSTALLDTTRAANYIRLV